MASISPPKLLCTGTLLGVPAALHALKADLEEVLREAEAPKESVFEIDGRVPLTLAAKILAKAAELTRCPHFGLLAGQLVGGSGFGLLALACQQQKTVGDALQLFFEHSRRTQRAIIPQLEIRGGRAEVSCAYSGGVRSFELDDCLAAMFVDLVARLYGRRCTPEQIWLSRRKPFDARPWRRLLHALPNFSSERSMLIYPAEILSTRIVGADPLLRDFLLQELETKAPRAGPFFREELERLFLVPPGRTLSVDDAAQILGLNRRTLHRRLAGESTTFRAVKGDARLQRAKQLIENTDMKLIEISVLVGYSDATAFSRAFRRWSGAAPSVFRKASRCTAISSP